MVAAAGKGRKLSLPNGLAVVCATPKWHEERQRAGGGAGQRGGSCSTGSTATAKEGAASSVCRPHPTTRSPTTPAQPDDWARRPTQTAPKKRTRPPRTGGEGRATRVAPPATRLPSAAPQGRGAQWNSKREAPVTAAAKPRALGRPVSGSTPRQQKIHSTGQGPWHRDTARRAASQPSSSSNEAPVAMHLACTEDEVSLRRAGPPRGTSLKRVTQLHGGQTGGERHAQRHPKSNVEVPQARGAAPKSTPTAPNERAGRREA